MSWCALLNRNCKKSKWALFSAKINRTWSNFDVSTSFTEAFNTWAILCYSRIYRRNLAMRFFQDKKVLKIGKSVHCQNYLQASKLDHGLWKIFEKDQNMGLFAQTFVATLNGPTKTYVFWQKNLKKPWYSFISNNFCCLSSLSLSFYVLRNLWPLIILEDRVAFAMIQIISPTSYWESRKLFSAFIGSYLW